MIQRANSLHKLSRKGDACFGRKSDRAKRINRAFRINVLAGIAGFLCSSAASLKAEIVWTGGGATNFWSDGANWSTGAPPGVFEDLLFGFPSNTTNFNDIFGGNFPRLIAFIPTAVPFHLTGGLVFLGDGGIVNRSTSTQTISFFDPLGGPGLILFDNQAFVAGRGNLVINSSVDISGFALTVDGERDTTINGSIVDNTFPAFGSLIKNGAGTLRLNAINTFPGPTSINGGILLVEGVLSSQSTFVNRGGTLGGNGLIVGHVFNSGNVAPGSSTGTLRIGGNFTQTKDGTLTIEIRSKTDHDLLAVQGHANLDGTLRLVKEGRGPRLKVGDRITILTAGGGVNGEFAKVVSFKTGTIVEAGVNYLSNEVVVEGKQGSFLAFAKKFRLTVNQRAVAGGLDKVAFRNRERGLIRYLNERPLEQLPGDFDRIAPDELASIFTTSVALANVQSLNLQRRTADLRSGARGFSAAGYHAAGSGPSYSGGFGVAGPTGNEGKESKDVFVPTAENRWGVFLTGVGEWVDVDGDGNARGYDITTGGFTLGADYKVTPNFAVGLSAGYAGTGADLTGDGRLLVNGGKLGAYATWFTGGFYVDGAVNGGYNSYDTKRSALQGTARGSTDGSELNVLFGTGYDWQVGDLTVGPTATFQYTYVGIDEFTERGSLAPLTIGDQSNDSLRTALGFKASYDWKVGGVVVKPEIRAAWQHEYGDDRFAVAAGFGGNGNLFTVTGPEIGRDSLLVGAGVAVLFNERTSTYLYYDGDLLRDNYDSHSVSGGVRVAF